MGGQTIVAVHGGPGAAGELAPLAESLSKTFYVFEPFQRRSSLAIKLSVDDHIQDLHDLIDSLESKPVLMGFSWGAMLSVAYAAEYPESIAAIVLIGCGTFDKATRDTLNKNLDQRLSPEQKKLMEKWPETDEAFARMGREIMSAYSYELNATAIPEIEADVKGFSETWADMVRLQEEGKYPGSFSAIRRPVVLIQGDSDPHPGKAIRDSLLPHIPHLEYEELRRCGHYPWLERYAKENFLSFVTGWMRSQPP